MQLPLPFRLECKNRQSKANCSCYSYCQKYFKLCKTGTNHAKHETFGDRENGKEYKVHRERSSDTIAAGQCWKSFLDINKSDTKQTRSAYVPIIMTKVTPIPIHMNSWWFLAHNLVPSWKTNNEITDSVTRSWTCKMLH